MERRVYKFRLQPGVNYVDVPKGAIPRAVGLDPETGWPAMWAEVNPDAPTFGALVLLIGTGDVLPGEAARYLGSVIGHNDMLVWHVYNDSVQPWWGQPS